MAYIFDLPQVIGVDSGPTHDGALIGKFTRQPYTGMAVYSQYHLMDYAVLQGFVTDPIEENWVEVQDNLNDGTTQALFTPGTDPNYNYVSLYISYRDGIDGYRFNCTTASTGTFTYVVEYNSPTGYITLPGATLSADFLAVTGENTLTLATIPTDWQEDYIGIPTVPRERWIRIRIDSGTVTTPPEVEGAWAKSAEPEKDINYITIDGPFINPYGDRIVTAGDTLYMSAEFKPAVINFAYTVPLVSPDFPQVEFTYSKADGTFGLLPILADLSSDLSAVNNHVVDATILTALDADASIASVEGFLGNGYVEASGVTEPTATTDRFQIGLSDVRTGNMKYGIFVTYIDFPRYQIIVDSTVVHTTDDQFPFSLDVAIWRYDGVITFFAGGQGILTLIMSPDDDLLYVRAGGIDNNVVISNVNLVDWNTSRYAEPIPLTWTENVDFDVAPNSLDANYPAMYTLAFDTPDDFASLSALVSKTGQAGYNIGMTNVGTPTQNVVLMLENYVGCDDPSNNLFKTGTQTILNYANLMTQNTDQAAYESQTAIAQFAFIIKNNAGTSSRVLNFATIDLNVPISTTQFDPKIGVTDVGVIQVGFQKADQDIGTPSQLSIST